MRMSCYQPSYFLSMPRWWIFVKRIKPTGFSSYLHWVDGWLYLRDLSLTFLDLSLSIKHLLSPPYSPQPLLSFFSPSVPLYNLPPGKGFISLHFKSLLLSFIIWNAPKLSLFLTQMPSIKLTFAAMICLCWLWKWCDLQSWCPAGTWARDHPSPHGKCKVLTAWMDDPISLKKSRGKFFNLNYLAGSLKEGTRSRKKNGEIQTEISFIPQDPHFREPHLIVTCIISESQRRSCCLVAKLCLTLCDPMDRSTSGFPALHYLPEFAQTYVHWVSDAILSLEHQWKVEVDRRDQFLEEMETGWVLSYLAGISTMRGATHAPGVEMGRIWLPRQPAVANSSFL